MNGSSPSETAALLRWYLDAGVDETVGEQPVDRRHEVEAALPQGLSPAPPRPIRPPGGQRGRVESPSPWLGETAVDAAVALARQAGSLAELRQALEAFDGCPLKATATNLVFGRGNPDADVALIGEAPGAEEDRLGQPFVGPSGRLLDRMLASIGLDERKVWISNTVFWRPPGNRSPTASETAACQPFLQRMLELVDPKILVALGGPAAHAILGRTEGVTRLRGRWFTYQSPGLARPVQATATFHPAYLLRSPAQKRLAWRDLLAIRCRLRELAGKATG